jgi:hypothetical protein
MKALNELEPLLVRLAPGLDRSDYEGSMETELFIRSSYNPATQTSSAPDTVAGTYKTYDPSFCGLFARRDDSNVSDH